MHRCYSELSLPSNLVSQRFARDDSYLFTYSLVSMKVQCQSSVVLLDNNSRGFFDSFCSDTTLPSITINQCNWKAIHADTLTILLLQKQETTCLLVRVHRSRHDNASFNDVAMAPNLSCCCTENVQPT